MANQISMSEKQSIEALHAQGVSNRQIAELLSLHRDTVNRHVRLLKPQNQPGAPPGDDAGISPAGEVQPGGSGDLGAVGGGEFARSPTAGPDTSAATVKAGGAASDVIWDEAVVAAPGAQLPPKTGPLSPGSVSQNQPGAPAGKIRQFELFDQVPRLSFASWEDPLRSLREEIETIQNRPQAPPGNSTGKDVLPGEQSRSGLTGEQPDGSGGEGQLESQNQPGAPPGKTGENSVVLPASEGMCRVGQRPGINTSLCTEHHKFIVAGLERGLEAQRIWQDLVNDHGFQGKYWSVKRYVRHLKIRQPLPFRRLETAAGVEAQVDFGQGAWVVGLDGKRRRPWVFRVVLSHSRKGYSEVVWRQTTEAFIDCLENAFRHFGGVPERIVLDNLKAAVTKADWYDPEIHPKIQSFAAHHGTVFLPTKPYTPRHKGKIEGGVKYVQNNALAGRTFKSLEEQNEYLWRWESQVADQRIHGTTKRQVRALFEEQEQEALRPLPSSRFPQFREERRTVHRDGYVEVDKAYYAAPPEYVGREVWVRWDSRILRIHDDRWQALYTHAITAAGQFRTCPGAIPREKVSAVERGVEALLKQVSRIGPRTRDWAHVMVQARGVEGTRVLLGLRALSLKHEASAIEYACELALASGSYRLRTIRELLKRHGSRKQEQFEFTQEHPVIRSLADYSLESLSEFRRDRTPPTRPSGEES